ncbi:ankyrin repeat domain-containing protein 26 isoform 3-T4 [Anableps anableps]
MKKLLSFTKKKRYSSGTPDSVSTVSDSYDLKDKDLWKIHKAAFQGDLAKLKQLAKKNDINQLDKENRTALHIACATGHIEVVQFLVDSKAKLDLRDSQNRSALMKAVQGQHERCVSILLENDANPNLADINGNTALHLAANIPSISTAALLLQHGAEINAQNMEGFTPLTVAVREDRIEMAEYLLKETADVNSLDREQRSPLMLAASSGQHSMVKLLLQFDPDITLQDRKGWSADDYAVKNGHHSCCLLITEYGTKRTHRASVSHPDPSKKKQTLDIPCQDVEPGLSLGGPATDKGEHGTNEAGGAVEDSSLSESVSRASKNGNDEWPSTEDEEESVGKKPFKVNLSRIFGSKMGEGDNSAERGKRKNSVQNLNASNSQEEGSAGEDSGEEVEEEEDEEEEEEEEEDDDDEEEEEGEEEEEEGEEDESDEGEENEEEDGSEEEENDNCVADSEDIQNCSATDIRAEIQNTPYTKSNLNARTSVGVKHEIDDASEKAKMENADINSPTGATTHPMPATLDVAGDYIVSAIRVESKLSDEEESFAKECMRSSDPKINSNQSSTEVPIPSTTQSPGKVKEGESDRETENDGEDSLSDEKNSADKVWNDSDDDEENKTEGIGGSTLITCPGKLLANVGKNVESDVEDDASSNRKPFEEGKRRSSWGSSVEGSDVNIPKESEANSEILQQENDVQPLGMQLEETILPPKEEQQPDTSWDSSSQCILSKRVIDDPESFAKPGLPISPLVKNKPSVVTADESDWDSSEGDNQNDTGATCEVASLDLKAADDETKETHKCSLQEEEKDSIEKESDDPSPVVSVVLECEDTKDTILCDDGEPAASLSLKEEKSDSENEEGNSSSWDDEEESDKSEKRMTTLRSNINFPSMTPEDKSSTDEENAEKAKTDNIQTEDDIEEIPYSLIDGNYEAEDKTKAQGETLAVDENLSKDNESSEDSDSKHQKLQYDFASATVKPLDAGDDSAALCVHASGKSVDESEARLTSYAPLENKTASVSKTRESFDEDQRREAIFSSPPTKNVDTSGQHHSSEVSDEALPQTDIDDVDLSSPDRSENTNLRWHELKSIDEPDVQEQNSIEDHDDDGSEKEHEDDYGDSSDTDSESEDSEEVYDEAPSLHKREVDMFYIPSFLRGNGGSRMAEIEPRKSIGSPQGSQGEAGSYSNDNRGLQKKNESPPKRESLSILSKPKEDVNIMEELGVGEIDDLEDGSEWDSTSSISKRTQPGWKKPSSGLEEFQEDGNASGSEQKEYRVLPITSTPQKSSSSGKSLPSTPSKSAAQLQVRAKKVIFQTPDNEEGTADFSLMTEYTQGSLHFEEDQQKEKDDAVDGGEFNLHNLGHGGSDTEEKIGGDTPWEKHYEKLWVEVEKREVKSTFKSVAGELKERFGELSKSRRPAKNAMEDTSPASSSASEDSSDEEEDVIVRPAARARSTVLLTIPEQRESGLEESVAESPGSSLREEGLLDCDQVVSGGFIRHKSTPLTAEVEGAASSQLTTAQKESEDDRDQCIKPTSKDNVVFATDSAARLREADWRNVGSEESLMSEPTSRNRRPDVSNKRHKEQDMTKFNPEISCKTTTAAVEDQKSSVCWDGSEPAVENFGSEKPETNLTGLLNQAEGSHQEHLLVSAQSTNRDAVQQKPAVEGTLQLEMMVRWARPGGAPQTNMHVNGDPSSVFDDSSLSDISDDEERLTSPKEEKSKDQSFEEIGMAEDLDELSQSSDTGTDDMDSPTSGYRHASLLMQKLDSSTLDSTSIAKLQNIFHEYERSIQKARSRHGYLTEKVNQLETERTTLKSSLEEVKDAKSLLERIQLELQTEVTNLKFQLKQEQENRHNASMMYDTTRDKLRRMEEQHQSEVQERQKVELTLRNLELEMRTLMSNMKQLEEEQTETQRLLAQERSARALQENLFNTHLRKQKEMEEESKINISRSNELTEASDRERELLQQTASLQEQLSVLRADLEQLQANSSLKESELLEENETLKEQLEDVSQDLKLSNEAVTQTVFTCNNQLAALKAELAKMTSRLESERQAREAVEAEAESTRSRLAVAVKEAELRLESHAETEKALLREKEEHQRHKDRLTGELATQRDTISSLSQKLTKAEAHINSMENEVQRVTLQLTEKCLLLDVLLREKEQVAIRSKELENTLQAEKEQLSRREARQEAMEERLAQAQSEVMLLRQQLEEAQNIAASKERAITDSQERFSDILSKLRSDCEERVQLVEERNKELTSKAADLRDQVYKLEEEKNERETNLRQLQQELADSLKKLSMSEASLEVNTRYRNDLEEEKARLLKDNDRLRGKLEESEDQYIQAERHMNSLKIRLGEMEKELSSAAQKLQEALSASATSEITTKQLEEAVQKLEIDNASLEAATKQQSATIEALQKSTKEAALLAECSPGGGVRGHLEEMVSNLQSSKITLEDQLNKEAQKQTMLSNTAQDSQALWEEEVKSRSKLGLRLAELEKEKGELTTQMDVEKKKAKKMVEQKKAVDTRLDQEMKRNMELQKEMYRLRTLLKTAKKKMRDQEAGGTEFPSPMNALRVDPSRHSQADGAFGWMKDKVDDLQGQLEKETSRRNQLEKINEELKDQVTSLKDLSHSNDDLERSKRQLEEEVLELRSRMEAAQTDQSQVDQYRREAEEKARQEIQQKLEQVNLFLQSQAASQEALDQIKAANEANLRTQLEQRIRELEGELARARTSQLECLNQKESTRSELERYRQLYNEEMRLRKSLTAKLERANSRLSEANSKLLSERSRTLVTGNISNGSLVGASLDLSSLSSPANPETSLESLNRSCCLGFPLPNPVTDGQNRRVEDYLAKMQSELDKNISKELINATAELDAATARLSPVGSASRVELDPLSRATQQYLEVLKKNHRI